jgi:hypothetical protein
MDNIISQFNKVCLCESCYTRVDPEDQFCNHCGYPLKGTEDEKRNFKPIFTDPTLNRRDYDKRLQNAANTLYYLTGVFVLSGIIVFFQTRNGPDGLDEILASIFLGMIFLALGGYTHKKPLASVMSGLALYIIIQILNIIADPESFISPITLVIKIVIIGFLIKGVRSAIEIEKIKKENNLK